MRWLEHHLAGRQQRKFVVGVLDQAATILGAMSASVLVVGLIGPYIATVAGMSAISPDHLLGVAGMASVFAACSALGAMVLKGLSRRADDEMSHRQAVKSDD